MLREGEVAFLLPGILSRGENFQALGIPTDGVAEYGMFGPNCFKPDWSVRGAALDVLNSLRRGKKVLLVGASLGGMLVPFVVREIRELLIPDEDVLSGLRCVIIDAPSGAKTMKAVGPFASRVITSPFGHLLRPLAHVKVLPKDDYIEVPDTETTREIAGEAMSGVAWRAYIKGRAKQELGGHSSKLWLEQLRWMIRVGDDGELTKVCDLEKACASLAGIDVAYLQCCGAGNDVVTPDASGWWHDVVPGIKMFWVEAAHCGFVQQAPTFRGALTKILG